MKIPNSVRIGGVEYEIKYEPMVRVGNDICFGAIDYTESTISLSETDCPAHQMRCVTLWHEILHGVRNHAGLSIENEEEVVDMFAKGIYQVLQDNGRRFFDIVSDNNAD